MMLLPTAFTVSDLTNHKLMFEFRIYHHPCTDIEQFSAVVFGPLVTPMVQKCSVRDLHASFSMILLFAY